MQTIESVLKTYITMSDDSTKTYKIVKSWDESKKKLGICLLKAGTTSSVGVDKTTQLILKNAERLGFGSVTIVNMIANNNGKTEGSLDKENLSYIVDACKNSDTFVYAAGTAVLNSKRLTEMQSILMEQLQAFKDRTYCLGNDDGPTFFHVLYPLVQTWELCKFNPKLFTVIFDEGPKKQEKSKSKKKEEVEK